MYIFVHFYLFFLPMKKGSPQDILRNIRVIRSDCVEPADMTSVFSQYSMRITKKGMDIPFFQVADRQSTV
ncbi:MAG: hypothetical protein D3906_05085 [Candidatus Electrothrix sp. AUS1_2]|nr:hypothetical protein [Candidatus Electrothrix sp. AUS1_2]